jgi:hypothetical protein
MRNNIQSVGFSLLDRTDPMEHETFDHTKLSAINVCPTWGITRYGLHRRMPTNYTGDTRSMALEMGTAAHEAFAAIRIAQLWYVYPDHARHHAVRLFGAARGETLLAIIRSADTRENAIRSCALETIATGGFEDSMYDKRRTLANLGSSIVAYANGYDADRYPVWVADRSNPTRDIGVELAFRVLVSCLTDQGQLSEYVLTGKIDGIHWHREEDTELLVHDNKTSGRLDESWFKAQDMSHQYTGYILAGSLIAASPIRRAVVRGVQIPLPKMILNGLQDVWVVREEHHREQWMAWLAHTVTLYRDYRDDPIGAPKYSHSCNRYFRPCPMIPFCTADTPEKEQILSEMVVDEWNPLSEEYDG